MLRIKLTANKKHKYVKFNHTRYFVFKLAELPKNFAEVASEEPIKQWFTYNGFTLINEAYLSDTYTLR
jgi:hypothetical protein